MIQAEGNLVNSTLSISLIESMLHGCASSKSLVHKCAKHAQDMRLSIHYLRWGIFEVRSRSLHRSKHCSGPALRMNLLRCRVIQAVCVKVPATAPLFQSASALIKVSADKRL